MRIIYIILAHILMIYVGYLCAFASHLFLPSGQPTKNAMDRVADVLEKGVVIYERDLHKSNNHGSL